MWKHLIIIATEIILVVAIGFLTEVAASSLQYKGIVWIVLFVVLAILIPTTWFRVRLDSGKTGLGLEFEIPEQVSFSISRDTIIQTAKLVISSLFNGILFGIFSAFSSILIARSFTFPFAQPQQIEIIGRNGSILQTIIEPLKIGVEQWPITKDLSVVEYEALGVAIIAFASLFVFKRLSKISGLFFCVVSSLTFSIVHMGVYPTELITVTILGNLFFSLVGLGLGICIYPLLILLIDFWTRLFNNTPQDN